MIKLFGGSLETHHHSRGPQPPPTATLKPLLHPSLDLTPTLNEHAAVDSDNGGPCRGNAQLLDWVGKHLGPETSHDPSPGSAGNTLEQVRNICMAGKCDHVYSGIYFVYLYRVCTVSIGHTHLMHGRSKPTPHSYQETPPGERHVRDEEWLLSRGWNVPKDGGIDWLLDRRRVGHLSMLR